MWTELIKMAQEASWEMSALEMPIVYHGGKGKVSEIDSEHLQQRDAGFYGKGFYVATNPKATKGYGNILSKFYISPEAKILKASLKPSEAPVGLLDAVYKYKYDKGIEAVKARNKEVQSGERMKKELHPLGSKAEGNYSHINGVVSVAIL